MPVERPVNQAEAKLTVRCVTAEFRLRLGTKYSRDLSRAGHFRNLCQMLEDEYGDVAADEFGPRRLSQLRDQMVAAGNCRRYLNAQVRELITIFRFGLSRELVKPETLVVTGLFDVAFLAEL